MYLLGEKIQEMLQGIGRGKRTLWQELRNTRNESQNKAMVCHKTKQLHLDKEATDRDELT